MPTTADVSIRELWDSDFPSVARIYTAINPHTPVTGAEMQHWFEKIDRERFVSEWLVAEERATGEIVGYGSYAHTPWSYHPHKYRTSMYVDPIHQRRGVGQRIADAILAAVRARGAERLTAWAREDWTRSILFLQRYGYAEHERDFELRLDVGSVDLQRFAGDTDRMAGVGIAITTLAEELRRDPACLPGVFQAYCVLDVSAPRNDPELPTPAPGTLGEFTSRLVEGPRALPDAFFLAKFGELYVGLCMLMSSEGDPSLLYQELTGVLPAFQGLGIATALKLRTVEYARRRGCRTIRTINSSMNDPMLAINDKLGFVRQPAWLGFIKRLEPGGAAGAGRAPNPPV